MSQKLNRNLKLNQKPSFNTGLSASLNILEMDDEEIELYLKEFFPTSRIYPKRSYSFSELFTDSPQLDSLSEEILSQVRILSLDLDVTCIEFLLSEIDSNGYFKVSLNEISQESGYSKEYLEYHLNYLHAMSPYGCFAFSLSHCLKIQCENSKNKTASGAYKLCEHLEAVAVNDIAFLAKKCNLEPESVQEAILFIKTLNPKPASQFSKNSRPLIPELEVFVLDDTLQVRSLNQDWYTQSLIEELQSTSEEMKNHRTHIDIFLNYLEKRNYTLLQIAKAMLEIHKNFFLNGESLNRCTLEMISSKTALAKSTISRAISNKSLSFNNKYYPLRSFLVNSGVDAISSSQIKTLISQLINEEPSDAPYSDSDIVVLLKEHDITISRRTVSKYRNELNLPTFVRRKL